MHSTLRLWSCALFEKQHIPQVVNTFFCIFSNTVVLCLSFRTLTHWNFFLVDSVTLCESFSVVSDSLLTHGLYGPWNSPGQNTGVGSLSLLQGIFPTQGLNPGLLHCRRILYQVSHKGSPYVR